MTKPRRTSMAGRMLDQGEPSYSALHGFCPRCGRLVLFDEDADYSGLCAPCGRAQKS